MYGFKYVIFNEQNIFACIIYINAYRWIDRQIDRYRYRYACKKLQPNCTIGLHKADLMQFNAIPATSMQLNKNH